MSVRELVLLAALGGCNSLWGVTEVGPTDVVDAPHVDGEPPLSDRCIPTFPSDTFAIGPACSGIGVEDGDADAIDTDAETLLVQLPGTGLHRGGCLSNAAVPFGAGGIFANVVVIAPGNDYNVLNLHWSDHVNTTALFATPTGTSLAHVIAPATTAPALGTTSTVAPWWRIRPSDDRSQILGEVSNDGTHWVQFAVDPVAAPDTAYVELSIGSFADEPGHLPSVATVASINVCP